VITVKEAVRELLVANTAIRQCILNGKFRQDGLKESGGM
jgi:hypothetical protein